MHETLKIKIDFAKNRQHPAEVFQAMSAYIEAYQTIGQILVGSCGGKEEFELQLDAVEAGSVASLLKAVPGRLRERISNALFKSASALIDDLSGIEETSTEEDVDILALQLESELESSGLGDMANPHIDRQQLAHALCKLSEANKKLRPEEKVLTSLSGDDKITPINTHWRFNANPKDMFLGSTKQHSVADKLHVKMPVNIGKGVWQFVSAITDRTYSARIADLKWLEDYQLGIIQAIGPKDIMEADVSYDVYTPPPGKGKPQIRNAKVTRVVKIHRNVGLQYELGPIR